MTKVVSIQYPSGGFGHFTHVVLSAFCKEFNGNIIDYNFGPGGDSHAYPLKLPKYFRPEEYSQAKFDKHLALLTSNYATVLIDSGIDNDSTEFRKFITPDVSVRICYDNQSWPLTARMFYTRCMAAVENNPQTIDRWISPDQNKWPDQLAPWAIREKYFLYLRDHSFRYSWRANDSTLNIPIESFLDYDLFISVLNSCFTMSDFKSFYNNWYEANYMHFKFYIDAQHIMKNLHNNIDIGHVDDYFTQALVYYYIWVSYQFEVPHNDCSYWFTNTSDIVKILREHNLL